MAKVTRKVKVTRGAGKVEEGRGRSKGNLEGFGNGGVLEATLSQQPPLGLEEGMIHAHRLLPSEGRGALGMGFSYREVTGDLDKSITAW